MAMPAPFQVVSNGKTRDGSEPSKLGAWENVGSNADGKIARPVIGLKAAKTFEISHASIARQVITCSQVLTRSLFLKAFHTFIAGDSKPFFALVEQVEDGE